MILYNTPLLMVLAFLVLTLVIGLCVSQKETTFRQYAVGNKRFQTITLVVTLLATAFGGGTLMRGVPDAYNLGMSYIFLVCAVPTSLWIIALLGLRMGPFIKHFSIAETIGNVYGKYPRIIAAVFSISVSIGIVAVQIHVMSSVISICIDSIDHRIVTVLATLVLTAYAIFGGVRAITITDILQFITFITIIALIAKLLFDKINKSFLEVILLVKKEEKLQCSKLFQFDRKLLSVIQMYICSSLVISPSIIHRVYMSSSPIQAYKVFLYVTRCSFIIIGCITLISLLVFIRDPTLLITEIWPYILADMLPVYKGCIVICLLGMTMSTTDSNLHTVSIIVSHDIVESIRNVKTGRPYVQKLRLAQLAILIASIVAMIVTIYYPDLFELNTFIIAHSIAFFTITVVPLFILAIFGFRGSSCTALIGISIAILTRVAWEKWVKPTTGIYAAPVSIIANGLAMMAAHYLLPQPEGKGWIGKNDQYKRMEQLIRVFKRYKKSIDLE